MPPPHPTTPNSPPPTHTLFKPRAEHREAPDRLPALSPFSLLALLLLTLAPACTPPLATTTREQRAALSQLPYPADASHGPDLDIVIKRDGKAIQLINRTARPYANSQLWLNQQYVRNVSAIRIGPDNRLALNRFINRHREPFPTGTFLAPDDAKPVLLAELYDPQTQLKHRLLVWPDDTEP